MKKIQNYFQSFFGYDQQQTNKTKQKKIFEEIQAHTAHTRTSIEKLLNSINVRSLNSNKFLYTGEAKPE